MSPLPFLAGGVLLVLFGADPAGVAIGLLAAFAAWDFLHLDQR